ncbi:MAG: hypothetical protein AB7I13_15450 [Vicinamibacterales bacterium]
MQGPSGVDAPRCLWLVERPDGYTMQCDVAPHAMGWMVWFTVGSQRIGGHRFESLDGAKQWGHQLLQDIQRSVAPVSA